MATHPDLQAEQAHIDRAYRRLDDMRAQAAAMRDAVLDHGKGGTHQAREERDSMMRQSLARLDQLQIGRESLCFGRVDTDDHEAFHIGRLPVSDVDQEPLVVDWRAPVAEPFYRATGRHPMGLTRRRHFITDGRRIAGIEDEVFDLAKADEQELRLAGEGALLAALERSRTGQMRDIVATIQGEQDEIIRAPLHGVIVVQGGPGTGKTAVALHRAAYLLYTHRFPLEIQGVLVVGPNPLFMRYIEHVLPSLGETGVHMTTITGLVHDAVVRGRDTNAAARVKSDARMAKVVAKAVRDRQRALKKEVSFGFGAVQLRISPAVSADVVSQMKRRPGTHNARRKQVEAVLAHRLFNDYQHALTRLRRSAGLDEPASESTDDERGFVRALRHDAGFIGAVDRMWPELTAQELLHDLFGAPALIGLAGAGVLNDEECGSLRRPRSPSFEQVDWTRDDIALLDEAGVHLGPTRAHTDDEHQRSYGHIVVDEAQDLSPMQLRMLARRSLAGSMTIVGDIGQATGHWRPSRWDDVLRHLPQQRPPHVVELSVNYRTPAEVMTLASRVLAVAAPTLKPPISVRSTGAFPRFERTDRASLAGRAVDAARSMSAEVGDGSVALVCPPSLASTLQAALSGSDIDGAGEDPLIDRVSVVPADTVKGLEFDGVIVVEPAHMVAESPQGLSALYVALTRCTKLLTIVHADDLPAPLLIDDAANGEIASRPEHSDVDDVTAANLTFF
ncbi:MAG TPA: UvrD-helicase domain-containing protein [Acidimicrobiales bacterium]|nr:UvrD-helicase domain-containing protein [Acidimicrobiales bacterium]